MKKFTWIIIVLVIAVVGGYFGYRGYSVASHTVKYSSEEFGISFKYPDTYFVNEVDVGNGERRSYAIVLIEDTEENRKLVDGELPGREGSPTITIGLFQNNLDGYDTESWVRNTSFSNFKLSDGTVDVRNVGGEAAITFDATGLYENKNAVVALPDYVYMFTAFYLTPEDQILKDFEKVLNSVKFDQ